MSFRMNSLPDGWATFPGEQRQALGTQHVLSSEILLKFQGHDASRADFQVIPWPRKSGVARRETYTPRCAPGALGIWSEVICRGGAGYRTDILQPALRPPSNIGLSDICSMSGAQRCSMEAPVGSYLATQNSQISEPPRGSPERVVDVGRGHSCSGVRRRSGPRSSRSDIHS